MNTEFNSDADWRPCAPGEIGLVVRRMRWRQRRPLLVGVAAGAAVILIAGVMVLTAGRGAQGEYEFGGITCSEVRARGQAYMAGTIDADLRRRIDLHLTDCPECGPLFRRMMRQPSAREAQASASTHSSLFGSTPSGCDCPECRFAAEARPAAHTPTASPGSGLLVARR